MNEHFKFLFSYLEKEKIDIDKDEFIFQIQSHPYYPSLLSISDTLNFLNVDNIAVKVNSDEIDKLPTRFVCLLSNENFESKLFFVEKRGDNYLCIDDKKTKTLSKSELANNWKEIVLIAEKQEIEKNIKTQKYFTLFPIVTVVLFFAVLFTLNSNLNIILFILFPILGILLSIGALKDLFGTKSELINKFCNITSATSCETIIKSSKWKIFKFVNFSDLSITFFSFQFLGLFYFLVLNDITSFFSFQAILIYISIPIILSSLYFQKFIEKKWCPICLLIISVIIGELIYIILNNITITSITISSILSLIFIYLLTTTFWFTLKKTLQNLKELKEFQFKANRFMRNYEVFKNNLKKNKISFFPNTPIVLGNKNSKLVITIISNPFCGYCEKAHSILNSILEKHQDNLQINIILKTDINSENETNQLFFRTLLDMYISHDEKVFLDALAQWFNIKNVNDWLKDYKIKSIDLASLDSYYNIHNEWCWNNNFTYTPAIFINEYEYPNTYDRDTLEFFINEIIEDTDFN